MKSLNLVPWVSFSVLLLDHMMDRRRPIWVHLVSERWVHLIVLARSSTDPSSFGSVSSTGLSSSTAERMAVYVSSLKFYIDDCSDDSSYTTRSRWNTMHQIRFFSVLVHWYSTACGRSCYSEAKVTLDNEHLENFSVHRGPTKILSQT